MSVGDKIREARKRARLSQTDLSSRSGIQPAAISHFESGRRLPSINNLIKLCKAMNASADEILETGRWIP